MVFYQGEQQQFGEYNSLLWHLSYPDVIVATPSAIPPPSAQEMTTFTPKAVPLVFSVPTPISTSLCLCVPGVEQCQCYPLQQELLLQHPDLSGYELLLDQPTPSVNLVSHHHQQRPPEITLPIHAEPPLVVLASPPGPKKSIRTDISPRSSHQHSRRAKLMQDFSDDLESAIGFLPSDVSSPSSSISSPDISYSSGNSSASPFITSLISASSQDLSSTNTHLDTVRAYNARRRLAIEETEYLIRQFHKKPKPTTKEQREIAAHLNLQPRTVQVWFQNRRAKLKRDDTLARDLILDEEGEDVDVEEEREEEFEEEMRGEEGDGHGSGVESQGRTNNRDDHMVSIQTNDVVEQLTTVRDSKDRLGTGGETFLGFEFADTVSDWMQLFESAGFQSSTSPSSDEGPFTPLAQDGPVDKEFALSSVDNFGNATFCMEFGGSDYDIDSGSKSLVSGQDVLKEGIDSTLLPSCRIAAVNGQTVGRDVQKSVEERKISTTQSARKRHRSTSHSKAVVTSLDAHANMCPGDRNGNPPSSSRVRRVSILRRRNNPIPRQQMAFTLIADS